MAYVTLAVASRGAALARNFVWPNALDRRGLFRRMLDAMIASRQRQADREIARFLRGRGCRLTDDIEREIERRFLQRPSGQL